MVPPRLSPEAQLVHEFTLYYQADELPDVTSRRFREGLSVRAAASAQGLADRAGAGQCAGLARVLRRAAADPADPLLVAIVDATQVDWLADAGMAGVLRTLLQEIASRLDRAAEGAAPGG